MHFDLSDLTVFTHVAESPSLTRGARRAHLSPAAVSARIKALEEQLGTKLFYRDSRGVMLTPSGIKLLAHARKILRQVACVKSEFSEYQDKLVGHIRIFANTTAVAEFLPELLADLLSEYPDITVDLQERLSRDIIRGILDGSADLGLIAGPVKRRDLDVIPYTLDSLVLAVPPGHPLASRSTVSLAETLEFPHISLHEGSTLFDLVTAQTEDAGKKLPTRIQVSSYDAICRMIEAGVGIGILPGSVTAQPRFVKKLRTVELDEPWAVRERSILVKEADSIPRFMQVLVDKIIAAGKNKHIHIA